MKEFVKRTLFVIVGLLLPMIVVVPIAFWVMYITTGGGGFTIEECIYGSLMAGFAVCAMWGMFLLMLAASS